MPFDDAADIVEQGKNKHQKLSKSEDEFCIDAKNKRPFSKMLLIGFILMAICFWMVLLVMFTELRDKVNELSNYVAQKSPFTNVCSSCADIELIGGKEYTKFEKWFDGNGCLRLTITCGLEHGTEAIIQWYDEDKNMGVSFMEMFGQTNVIRSLECNESGHYELFENGHRGKITKIECIVVRKHQEL